MVGEVFPVVKTIPGEAAKEVRVITFIPGSGPAVDLVEGVLRAGLHRSKKFLVNPQGDTLVVIHQPSGINKEVLLRRGEPLAKNGELIVKEENIRGPYSVRRRRGDELPTVLVRPEIHDGQAFHAATQIANLIIGEGDRRRGYFEQLASPQPARQREGDNFFEEHYRLK